MHISLDEFAQHFTNFTTSAKRIETLPFYDVPEERANFELFLSGAPLPADRETDWSRNVRHVISEGGYMGRVHIIDRELTPYLQFEIAWYYETNSPAGEDIRFIFTEDVPDVPHADTWIFDDTTVLELAYSKQAELMYINRTQEPDVVDDARTAWSAVYERSFPLTDLLGRLRNNPVRIP